MAKTLEELERQRTKLLNDLTQLDHEIEDREAMAAAGVRLAGEARRAGLSDPQLLAQIRSSMSENEREQVWRDAEKVVRERVTMRLDIKDTPPGQGYQPVLEMILEEIAARALLLSMFPGALELQLLWLAEARRTHPNQEYVSAIEKAMLTNHLMHAVGINPLRNCLVLLSPSGVKVEYRDGTEHQVRAHLYVKDNSLVVLVRQALDPKKAVQ